MGRPIPAAYFKFMKFSVAPESRRATVSALFRVEWMYKRTVIDFRFDRNTSCTLVLLIEAAPIRLE